MREFESTYDSCTKDWETRCQLSETRLSALTLELAGAKAEYQRASDESAQLREAATVSTEQVISSTVTELTTENESLRASLCTKDETIAQLEASVVNLTEEKSALLTQLEAATNTATTYNNTATKAEVPCEITTDANSTAQAESTSPSTTPTPEASSELPSLKTATSQQPYINTNTNTSINSSNGCPTHIFHYVPAEYSDQSWSECIPPSVVSGVSGAGYSHSETYHHVYHAPPPRYSSPGPGRFQTSSDMPIGVSSSMTARELATLMARSSTHTPHVRPSNNSRYASPVRRSYANPPADFGELTHLEEIRMKLDILKSLTDPTRIAIQRVVRAAGPFSSNYDTGHGMMSYYDNLRASLHK